MTILRRDDGSYLDLTPADLITDFPRMREGASAGDAGGIRTLVKSARAAGHDVRDAVLARMPNGWAIVTFDPDPVRRQELIDAIATAKAERLPVCDLAAIIEHVNETQVPA